MTPKLQLPKKLGVRLVQAEIDLTLWAAVEREKKKNKVTIKDVVEYGLAAYLLASNPTEYERYLKERD